MSLQLLLVAVEGAIVELQKEPANIPEAVRLLERGQTLFFQTIMEKRPDLMEKLLKSFGPEK